LPAFDRDRKWRSSAERDTLHVTGRKQKDATERTYLHRGIAARDFEQRFQLANHVKVTTASFDNGMLTIDLVREVPEALKPRKIADRRRQRHRDRSGSNSARPRKGTMQGRTAKDGARSRGRRRAQFCPSGAAHRRVWRVPAYAHWGAGMRSTAICTGIVPNCGHD
jgi:hypothetical protein